jgi:hypothetical protein
MSTKFEQLLDYLVNEDHEKASELFHEIVVEKSREIYENIIAQEGDEEDEEMDEALEEDDEEMDEAFGDQEDSYKMDDEEEPEFGGDASDKSLDDVEMDQDGEEGAESQEDQAIFDIKNAIEELEAAFAELEAAQDSEKSDMDMGSDDDMDSDDMDSDDDEDTDEEMIGMAMENRRMTREYVEKVGNDWDKNSQKTQGAIAGANTGEKMPTANDHRSPISSGKGKPTTGANANNIAKGGTGEGNNTGTKPNSVNKGITPEKSGNYTGNDWAANSAPGGKAKGYTQKADRMPMKQAPEGQAVGAGSGDNSVKGATNTSSVVAEGRRTTSKRK